MSNRGSILAGAISVALLLSSRALFGQGTNTAILPTDPDSLVKLLIGESLPDSYQKHAPPDTTSYHASELLIAMGEVAIPALDKAFGSGDEIKRLNIVFVLGHFDSPAANRVRIRAVSDPSPRVRALAVESLPVYADQQSQRIARDALSDSDSGVRNAAIRAFSLQHLGAKFAPPDKATRYAVATELVRMIPDHETRYAATEVLGQLGMDLACEPLLKAMADEPDPVFREQIVQSLGAVGGKQHAVEVARYLHDSHPLVRGRTAQVLSKFCDLRTTPDLATALRDPDIWVRVAAAEALGSIGDRRAVPALLVLLDEGGRPAEAAALALGTIGDPAAVDKLIASVQRDDQASKSAVVALGELGDPKAIHPLGVYLRNHRDSKPAAVALGNIRHGEAIAELAAIASTEKSIEARVVLGRLVGRDFTSKSPEAIAAWWKQNHEPYERPVPPQTEIKHARDQ